MILDLGCGTGTHAIELAKIGYAVTGVDRSEEMLERASERLSEFPKDIATRLAFFQGDIRTTRQKGRFDAVVSLFHLFSYLPRNGDLREALATAKAHLHPNGIFIFDYWYGTAVLSDPPSCGSSASRMTSSASSVLPNRR